MSTHGRGVEQPPSPPRPWAPQLHSLGGDRVAGETHMSPATAYQTEPKERRE